MADKDTNELEMSHKGQKIHSYPVKMKLEAVNYAEIHGNISWTEVWS